MKAPAIFSYIRRLETKGSIFSSTADVKLEGTESFPVYIELSLLFVINKFLVYIKKETFNTRFYGGIRYKRHSKTLNTGYIAKGEVRGMFSLFWHSVSKASLCLKIVPFFFLGEPSIIVKTR